MGFVFGLVFLGVMIVLVAHMRRGQMSPGPGAAGAVYDMLNQDKRRAIEIIVEGRAERRDPENKDGNLPELENPSETPKTGSTHSARSTGSTHLE